MLKKGKNIYKRKDGRWEGRYIRFYDEQGKAKYGYDYAETYNEANSFSLTRSPEAQYQMWRGSRA